MTATMQEQAWKGEFGNAYVKRSPGNVDANYELFCRIFPSDLQRAPATILELGAGTGANIKALKKRFPKAYITGVELNKQACQVLQEGSPEAKAIEASVLDWEPSEKFELVLTKGLLIHIAPDFLKAVYHTIHKAAGRFILLAEYYNPTPLMVPYRGEKDRLWKRDFAGEMLDRFPDLVLRSYGFVYHRDTYPQDDLTWMLMEKINGPR